MREIKYKVFDKKSKDMPTLDYINLKKKTVVVERDSDEAGARVQIKSFDDVIVMQYTDVFDKFDEEICEGDMVCFSLYNDKGEIMVGNEIGTVIYQKGSFIVKTESFNEPLCDLKKENIKIIGNIFKASEQKQMGETKTIKIARWFLNKEPMSPKKIQKLVYYAYSRYLVLMNDDVGCLNNKLFDEEINARVHGPVINSVYEEYKGYKFQEIPKQEIADNEFDEDTLDVLNQVWDVYGKFSEYELESIVHQEEPWIKARRGLSPLQNGYNGIDDRIIFEYYMKQMEI